MHVLLDFQDIYRIDKIKLKLFKIKTCDLYFTKVKLLTFYQLEESIH